MKIHIHNQILKDESVLIKQYQGFRFSSFWMRFMNPWKDFVIYTNTYLEAINLFQNGWTPERIVQL